MNEAKLVNIIQLINLATIEILETILVCSHILNNKVKFFVTREKS